MKTDARKKVIVFVALTFVLCLPLCGWDLAAAASAPPPSERFVHGPTLVSARLPEIEVRLEPAFRYLGRFPFRIREVAAGERFVFVDTEGERVKRLFIAQFEGFLPDNELTYNYSFANAERLGSHRFRHNVFAFSMTAAEEENPQGEAALTGRFLTDRGLRYDDEWMMSRFVTVPDAERRHELILFYVESVGASGHRLEELYSEDDEETEVMQRIGRGLTARSRAAFEIVER